MDRARVWIPDPIEGFILGQVVDLGMGEVTVQPLDTSKKKITCSLDRTYTAEEHDNKDVDDNCALMFLNEATLLNNIRTRYLKDKIYTYVANILIAVNPYYEIRDLYSSTTIKKYQGRSLGLMPPHVFAIADKSFRDMKSLKQSQSIIVSGESGAGKTESTKYLLRYLCELWGSAAGPVEQRILDANPVLEAFGNAKTTRNNNSSRFGKFMEVHFDSKYQVVGGYISHYLLEKSRICVQASEERNYHVFYLLCAGAPEQLRSQLGISNPDHFRYLNKGCTQYFTTSASSKKLNNIQKSEAQSSKGSLSDSMLDDVEDFARMDQALSRLGLKDAERLEIYTIVAAVLHLGNVTFEESEDRKGGCQVAQKAEKSLNIAATLMGVDREGLRQSLVSKVMMTARGGFKGTVIMVPLKVYEANSARDALAKALYSNLFDHIVRSINKSIPFKASSYYIGVLDIAGFEYFTVNSFEQFCINYCNEKLQQFFNERILKDEQELYKREGLHVRKIEFVDNQDCIDLLETKGNGIFSLLDEESKLPKHSPEHFTNEVHRVWNGHFRLALPRTSRLKAHREIRDDEGFLVRHFAGAVCYHTTQFIEKNNDALHTSLECLVQESHNKFLQSLFPVSSTNHQKGKLAFDSVGLKFKTQLQELMDKLKSTGTSFVRCIKPNQKMVHHQFEGGSILSQLQCSGMTSVLELMEMGYPSRAMFSDLYSMYTAYMTADLKKLDPRLFCKVLLHAMGMNINDYAFGITKVFFRSGKFAEFDLIMKSDPENLQKILDKVKVWLINHRWRKAQWCALSVIKLKNKIQYRRNALVKIQSSTRMFLCKKKHQPRYRALANVNSLQSLVQRMLGITQQLKADKGASEAEVKALQSDMISAVKQIKMNATLKPEQLKQLYSGLVTRSNSLMSALQKKLELQKNRDEQERLKKIQEEMERERKLREAEEERKREEEEIKRKKAEMEARRKQEEEEARRREAEELVAAKALEATRLQQAAVEAKLREQLEQERRDHELALRLAQESNGQVEDLLPSLRSRSPFTELITAPNQKSNRSENGRSDDNKKFDLSKWKYSELRDAINTSCDIDLLEACREEFHRRLKVYHAWKAKNKRRVTDEPSERAPKSIMEAAAGQLNGRPVRSARGDGSQRYFRIPFIRPSALNGSTQPEGEKKGWWYAHFDGQYVARQMELHPEKQAILLVAGVDDMQMCELSLEETGLTRKRGAEILEAEFNKEWTRWGGKTYESPSDRAK